MEPGLAMRAARPIEYTLSSISTTSAIITRFIRSVRVAHADLAGVTRELSDMRLLLELLRDEPGIPLLLQAEVLVLLESCGTVLVRIDSVLEYCRDTSQWVSTGKSEIARHRASLDSFRAALALALEIVNLSASQTNSPDARAIGAHIVAEVDRIRREAAPNGRGDEGLGQALEPYLSTLLGCVQMSQGDDPRPEHTTRPHPQSQPSSPHGPRSPRGGSHEEASIEQGFSFLNLEQETGGDSYESSIEQNEPKPRDWPEFGQQFETAGPWYPGKIQAPSPNPTPEPIKSIQQMGPMEHSLTPPPLRPLRESPILGQLQPQPIHRPQASPPSSSAQLQREQQNIPQNYQRPQMQQPSSPVPSYSEQYVLPSQQPVHRSQVRRPSNSFPVHSEHTPASPSTRSEPFSQAQHPGQMGSPVLRSDRWSEPLHNQGQGYRQELAQGYNQGNSHSYNPSIASASMLRVGRSDSPLSSVSTPRFPSSISQVSGLRPDSSGPGVPPSGSLSPAPSFQRMQTPKSPTQWSFVSSIPELPPPEPISRPTGYNPHHTRVEVTPAWHLKDKGKSTEVLHIDCSPTASYVVTKHATKLVKIWSVAKNALHASIKITSYVQPQVRSREYYIRSHAILSESATLVCVTTHFGLTLEIYNFAKGSGKKVQVIDEAHRWAASQLDAFKTDYAPLVVYRPKGDRLDRFFVVRNPGAKKPLWEDANNSIELLRAGLPFVPKFPELAYSANSPYLVAAAGPRPGDPPRVQATILIAWELTPVSDEKLQARSPVNTIRSDGSGEADERHKPYRFIVPEYPALQTSVPACLAAHGNIAVSIWIPANHTDVPMPGGKFMRKPVAAPERYVVIWDLPSNTTKVFAIPNVQACVSPDCRLVAYCDVNAGQFVVVDVANMEDVWRWPDSAKGAPQKPGESFAQFESLSKISVFEFSPNGQMLVVGDAAGAVGVYQVREVGGTYELLDPSSVNMQMGIKSGTIAELQS
ncbi:hypothetical protein B0T24DRAFT_233264 [Lasiosphaeria ovina]|uniref:Uncharacterized protein n=1 Tax=Lasiosphaeria ovina TaxID=92902 RepID=A0AAE0KHN9_9PEZI|nr:hypothetical protein B0T24DRAFT_233264 [Lasiosphaeria ovina]